MKGSRRGRNKFGEIRRAKRWRWDSADHDTIFWYHGMAASIQCLQAPSLRSGSPYYYLSVVFFYLSKLLLCLSVINSKDKNTYLKLRVNQVRKRSNKEKFRALEQLQIYLHQGINITSKNKSIHTGRFEALCCHYRMIKT